MLLVKIIKRDSISFLEFENMAEELPLWITATENADEVYSEIAKNIHSGNCYKLNPKEVTLASIDFITIIQTMGSIAGIASLIWEIYEKKIKNHGENGRLYIVVDPSVDLQWVIGEEYTEKKEFIEDFTLEINKYKGEKKDDFQKLLKESWAKVSDDAWDKIK